MSDKKSNDSRRNLLKSAVVGSGAIVAGKTLPENWAKPIVDTVVLPAHAVSTPNTDCNDGWITGESRGSSETQLDNTDTRCECEELVKLKEPTADGATWGPGDKSCYAEFGWTDQGEYTTKPLSESDCDKGWIRGEGAGSSETQLDDTFTRCECDQLVRSKEPTANGATWDPTNDNCYAEFGWNGATWVTKSFK